MKNISLLLIVFWVFPQLSFSQKIQFDSLDIFVQQLMNETNIPGIAIGIVLNDTISFSKGYGTKEINKNQPINENTIFGIGSISKSFTALTLGILVDEGKINWDDKVKKHLPFFELYDPYVTEQFTIRDLLTHRSGLKPVSGGTLWYHSDLSRTEIIKKLKYLEPDSGYRDKPAYQNVMYMIAGEIVKEVSGMSWDEFLQTRVFDKIKMKNSTSISAERESNFNLAQPHILNDNLDWTKIEQEKGDNLGAAGFIYSSSNDMCNYIKLLLNNGVFEGDTIISKNVFDEILTPQIIFPVIPEFHNEFTSYGLGLWLTPKNNHKFIDHSGGIDGMSAYLLMIKELNFGFIILSNSDDMKVFLLASEILRNIYDDSFDTFDHIVKSISNEKRNGKKERLIKNNDSRILGTKPSLKLEEYAGIYTDEMYGEISIIKLSEDELEISFSHTPLFRGKLEHWHYDTFLINWYDIRIPDGFLTFSFDSTRNIEEIKLDQENLLDVNFDELKIRKIKN